MVLVYKHVFALLVVPRCSHYALSVIVIVRLSDSLLKLLCSSFFNYTFIFVSTLLLDSVGISGLIMYVLFLSWQFVYLLCRNVLHSLEHVSRYSTYSLISGTVTSLSSGSCIWITWACIFVHWFHCVIIALDLFDHSTVLYLLSPVSYFTWNWHSLLCKSFYWSCMYYKLCWCTLWQNCSLVPLTLIVIHFYALLGLLPSVCLFGFTGRMSGFIIYPHNHSLHWVLVDYFSVYI